MAIFFNIFFHHSFDKSSKSWSISYTPGLVMNTCTIIGKMTSFESIVINKTASRNNNAKVKLFAPVPLGLKDNYHLSNLMDSDA